MSDSSASLHTCPQCGAALPAEATEGLCPRCLMAQAMETSQTGTAPPAAASEIPLPEELTGLLPADTYRVDYLIRRGGMGAVYRGAQLRLERPVAIKIMRREQGRDHGFEQRFQREALAMAKLNHPNIVSVIDYGEAGPDYLYIVMELVEGADLMDVIRSGRMTQEMALTLLPQICDALQFAHDHGIIHRDVKPSNVMLTRDGRIKIADFGLAKRHDVESSFHTRSGTGMGTPDYAAPEQFIAAAQVDHRADIYALGVMIYQMLTGQLPRGAWKPPTQHTPCDPHWDDIVSHAMQTDPKDRYQAASEVKSDVSRIGPGKDTGIEGSADTPVRSQSSGGAAATNEEAGKSARAPLQSRTWLVPVILASLIVISAGVFFASRPVGGGPIRTETVKSAGVHTFAGHRYRFVPGAMTWDEAKAKAESMGGHLVTITSREENAWIDATFGTKLDGAPRSASIWLGASAEQKGQPFRWVTGEPFTFTDWGTDEPNYATTTGKPVEGPFAISIKSHAQTLFWFDDPTSRANPSVGFIVEWDS